MTFAEVLPPQCPPQGASDVSIDKAYRAVPNMTPKAKDFASHAALNKHLHENVDPCRFASCSLFLSKEKLITLTTRLPKMRAKTPYIAELSIPLGAGISVIDQKSAHIDFWSYAGFDQSAAVQKVELAQ
jgi:hypothetical protein